MAALLDPRFKKLDFMKDDDERQRIIQVLYDEYGEISTTKSIRTRWDFALIQRFIHV
jgi:hypothetical protein